MSLINVQQLDKSGNLSPSPLSENGNSFPNGNGVFIQLFNNSDETKALFIPAVLKSVKTFEAGELPIGDIYITLSPNTQQLLNVPNSHTLRGHSTVKCDGDVDGLSMNVVKAAQ